MRSLVPSERQSKRRPVRIPAGRRLANADASCVRHPCLHPEDDPGYEGPTDFHRALEPNVREKSPAAPVGAAIAVETRAPAHELAYTVRPWGAWSAEYWTGQHGVIRPRPTGDVAQLPGGMQPWDAPRRTLRAAPILPFDAGTAVGPGQ